MGSVAYGASTDYSDEDIYGWCIPTKEILFPHLTGYINGFGTKPDSFNVFQQHHIKFKEKEYDICIYNIVHYFNLIMENNPNMIDSLFTSRNNIIHSTMVSEYLREQRKIFLHKGCYQKFKGYSYSELGKMTSKKATGKRLESIEKYGYDVKNAYNVIRLLNEVEQILVEGNLELDKHSELLKSIRRGEWSMERIMAYFTEREKILETAYCNSKLPDHPDEDKIKNILLHILEAHYGSLDKAVHINKDSDKILSEITKLLEFYNKKES